MTPQSNPRFRAPRIGSGRCPARCRGTSHVMILACSTVLMVIGLSAVTVSRVNTHATVQANHWGEAQTLAMSAMEHALATMNDDDDWRNTLQGETVTRTMSGATLSWQVVDEADGDLTDDASESATLLVSASTGTGRDHATYSLRMDLVVDSSGGGGGDAVTWTSNTIKIWGVDDDDGQLFSVEDYTNATDVGFTTYGTLKWDDNGTLKLASSDIEAVAVEGGKMAYMALNNNLGSYTRPVLLRFNLNNASTTEDNVVDVMGSIGWTKDVTGLSFDPSTGDLYATGKPDGGTGRLLKIDKNNGTLLAEVGQLEGLGGAKIDKPQGLAFDFAGNLFVVHEECKVYRVSKTTGELLELYDGALPDGNKYEALAWDSLNSRLIASHTGSPRQLIEVTAGDGNDVPWLDLGALGITDAEGFEFEPAMPIGGTMMPAASPSAITRVVE